jgi:HAD superfamily hydrolase (TIGR01549 family)
MTPRLRGVLFDVDGTLYHQGLLRALMMAELAAAPARLGSVPRARAVVRILRVYRSIHEEMRTERSEDRSLAVFQMRETARRLHVSEEDVRRVVAEWMGRRPLKYLRLCRRRELLPLLSDLERRSIRVGVLSDYPSLDKLEALEIASLVSPVLCTTDPEINALKPDPRGFWRACELWNLPPEEVVYVGDRPDVDARGAIAAGIRCIVVGREGHRGQPAHDAERARYIVVSSLRDVAAALLN